MTKTLITRIKNLDQYDSELKTILWQDPASSRWKGVYDKLVLNDNGIFITGKKLLVGVISEINHGQSFLLNNVKEVACTNDKFLQTNAAYPELISRVKANFQPFIHPLELNLNKIINEINDKNFVSFYLIFGYPKYKSIAHSLKLNDRVVIVNEDGSLNNVKKHISTELEEFANNLDISTNVKGLTIGEMLKLNQAISNNSKKSNNVSRLEDIDFKLKQDGVYKFNSFFAYHDTLYNKKVYLKNSNNQETNASQMTRIINLNGAGLYKISHGSFKANKYKHIIETLKQKNWITIHENTGKGRGDKFKNKLKEGDYVYITLGGEELIGIARIISNKCDYIPKEIINQEGWLFREIEMIREPVKKSLIELNDKRATYPSGNTSLVKFKSRDIQEANKLLFNPYFNVEFIGKEGTSTLSKKKYKYMDLPLNQILFGPPGTGKTYTTINKALEIINDNGVKDLKENDRKAIKKLFDKKLNEGQIVFTTFHQSMSYEDFIEGIKPVTKDGVVTYEVEPGLLKQICERIKNFEKLTNIESNTSISGFDELYDAFVGKLKNIVFGLEDNERHSFESRRSKVYLNRIEDDNTIITQGAKAIAEEKISKEKLKNIYDEFDSPDDITDIAKQIREVSTDISWTTNYFAVFKALKEFETFVKSSGKSGEKQNFILIIDEINRGNVSQIFGELITLIEEDKRLGKDEALEVTLPYSKEKFGVPPNLYIIGTMNTADRSVEALDTALRRRFSFTEMPPLYHLTELKYEFAGTTGKDILKTINKRIEKLLDRDHLIGHSYFLLGKNEDLHEKLINSFYRNIIPLLQEYFFGDYAKIGAVLGRGFIKFIDEGNENIFSEMEGFESGDYLDKSGYEIVDYRNTDLNYSIKINNKDISMDFEKAIKLLTNIPLTSADVE